MEPHFQTPPGQPSGFNFPVLPIVTPGEAKPRLTVRDKYGGLFYLGVIGLAILVALVAWFAWGAWSLRAVWSNVYVLHDRNRPEAERVAGGVCSEPRPARQPAAVLGHLPPQAASRRWPATSWPKH